ncbi:glutaredoxin family protein [Gallaecimonas sp. GXIMD4217]|uniref:glutaredoxin family protein n=1 Tax=Gallaecimonas sp. GXIMD4217 TaxID=3131927 RepID=UPI00311B3DE6
MTLILYSTDGCHLCDEAKALADGLALQLEVRDIMDQPAWLDAYRIRIPVLVRDDGAELGWPFDGDRLKEFAHGAD